VVAKRTNLHRTAATLAYFSQGVLKNVRLKNSSHPGQNVCENDALDGHADMH